MRRVEWMNISGRNYLTDKIIDKFTIYYANAIRGNNDYVPDLHQEHRGYLLPL